MIIGVDIGGTKTYIARFAENGKLLDEVRFETNHNYESFMQDLAKYAQKMETAKAKMACVAVPGLLNREKGTVISLGNLPWKDRYIQHDAATALGIQETYIENDSKLAGLSEARYLKNKYHRIFYVTFSTGIGGALLVNGSLVPELMDMEVGKMPLVHEGKITHWEDFASGRAFSQKYSQHAVDVSEPKVWEAHAQLINQGLGVICSAFQPEAIVFGGGLGQYLNRFEKYLTPYLQENLHSIVRQPKELLSTHYRGQSVIYGCYQYGKDQLTHY